MIHKHLFTLLLASGLLLTAFSEDSIIAHWSFDTQKADTFYNVVQDDYHVSSPYLKTEKGVLGNALSLSGTSFKPVVQNSSKDFMLSQFSVEAWVMINEDPAVMGRLADQYKILEYSSIGSYNGFSFCIFGGGRPDISLGQSSWINCTSPESMKLNRWYHLVGTCDGQMLKIYINGRKVNQQPYSGPIVAPNADATIGCQVRTSGDVFCHFSGLIDELKLYNYALDSVSIMNNYTELNPYKVEPQLLAHWSFDKQKADTFYNEVYDDYHISSPYLKTEKGVLGNALSLSGTSFKPVVQNSSKDFMLSQFSVEAWVMINEDPAVMGRLADQYKILEYTSIGAYNGFSFCIHGGGKPDITIGQSSWIECTSPEPMELNRWYHLVGTCDGQMLKIYINGRKVNQQPYSGPIVAPNADATIGCQVRTSGDVFCHFSGLIDELKLYNYALDAQSIQSSYNQLKPADEQAFEINLGMKTIYAQPDDTVVMPVYITNFEDFSISACQFSMKYNSSIVELLSITKDSGIVNTWPLFNWNPLSTDSARIAIAGIATPISYGEGELVRCIFRVKPTTANHDTCTILINNISFDDTYKMLTATSMAGKIIISNNSILYGDVTGNGDVNIFDAQKVMSYVVGALDLPDSICCPNFTTAVADVSGNGAITSFDAALIFQHSVGLLPEFPVTQTAVKKAFQKKTAVILPVAHLTTQIEHSINNELKCTIIGSNLKGFVAGEFSIGYDPSVIALSRGSITTSVKGATLNSRIDQSNQLLKVAIITNDDIDQDNPVSLLSITLPPTQGNIENAFSIISASLNEGNIAINFKSANVEQENLNRHAFINNSFKISIRGNRMTVNTSDYGSTADVTIWTLHGKSIFSKNLVCNISCGSLTIDQLPPGSYLYSIKNNKVISNGKFVITY